MFTFFKNSISISELGCLFILRSSGFAPSTRRWTRPWAEKDRTWRQAAQCRSWSLPSPEQLRTRFIRKGDWRMRHMRVAGCLESPTAGWMFTLLHLHLDNFTYMLRNWKVLFVCFPRGVLKWCDGRIYTGAFKNGLEDGWVLEPKIS